ARLEGAGDLEELELGDDAAAADVELEDRRPAHAAGDPVPRALDLRSIHGAKLSGDLCPRRGRWRSGAAPPRAWPDRAPTRRPAAPPSSRSPSSRRGRSGRRAGGGTRSPRAPRG